MRSHYKHGDFNAICDRCGFQYKGSELREEWTGLRVCSTCWEPRHPQTLLRVPEEASSLPWTRPEATDVFIAEPDYELNFTSSLLIPGQGYNYSRYTATTNPAAFANSSAVTKWVWEFSSSGGTVSPQSVTRYSPVTDIALALSAGGWIDATLTMYSGDVVLDTVTRDAYLYIDPDFGGGG